MNSGEPRNHSFPAGGMPETRISRWALPSVRFLPIESRSGFLLLACTDVALLRANFPWSASLAEIWQIRLRIAMDGCELNASLRRCINDGLMTMSIFIGSLALAGDLLDDGTIGTLAGSAISAILGCALLLVFMPMGSETTGTLPTRETLGDDSTASIGERLC